MKTIKPSLFTAGALAAAVAFAGPVLAQAPGAGPSEAPPPAQQLQNPELTDDMQAAIRSYFESQEPVIADPAPDKVDVGQAVPEGVTLTPLPSDLVAKLPSGNYGYYVVKDEIVVVDLGTKRVVARVPRA